MCPHCILLILFAIVSFVLGKLPWFKERLANLKKKLVARHVSSCEEDECHHSHEEESDKEK